MFSAYYSNAGVWLVKSMILVARGNMPEPRVIVDWASRAKDFNILVPGAGIQCTWYQATGWQVWWYCVEPGARPPGGWGLWRSAPKLWILGTPNTNILVFLAFLKM